MTGFTEVTANSESALKDAVKLGPVSVAVEADQQVSSDGLCSCGLYCCGLNR